MNRPDGTNQIYGGWISLGLAAVLLFIGINIEVSSYNPGSAAERIMILILSACMVGIAFWLLVAGWIIRAIYFLPGRDDAVLVTDKPTLELTEKR